MKKRTVRQNVEAILSGSIKARNNDKHLMMIYWKVIDGIDFNKFQYEFAEKATSPESIRRSRQLIQEEGLFPPTVETAKKRRGREAEMKKAIINHREVV
jgi:hypothetical protein